MDKDLEETIGTISGSFDSENAKMNPTSFNLLSAATTKTAQTKTLSLFLSGQLLDKTLSNEEIGTITIAFEPSI